MFEKHCCRAQTREADGWGGLSAIGDAGGGGASPESMSRTLTCNACEIGQNHSAGVCGSRAGFPATRIGGGGRWRPTLLLRWAV